jgi:Fe-S-cluster-containing dehydrogenase component
VLACPTHARHFGDLGDPDSAVSKLVAEREGFGMLPDLGYKPVNRYLPPRSAPQVPVARAQPDAPSLTERVAGWVNKLVER